MPTALANNGLFVDFDPPVSLYDSKEHPLTASQADFFKNSKCVDEDGNLYIVYHAHNNEFTSFDTNRIGSGAGSIWGKGFYFSTERDSVSDYGDTIKEYYLNLKNPYRYEAFDEDADAFYNVENFMEVLKRNKYPISEELQETLEKEILENDGNLDTLIELTCGPEKATQFFKTCGFDGIMNLDTLDFMAYSPNQIKLCSNKQPTTSNDVTA